MITVMDKRKIIVRDISWLAFNGRVLQEAGDETVPLTGKNSFSWNFFQQS